MVSPASLVTQMKMLNLRAMYKEARTWESASYIKDPAVTHTKMLWVVTTLTKRPSSLNNHLLSIWVVGAWTQFQTTMLTCIILLLKHAAIEKPDTPSRHLLLKHVVTATDRLKVPKKDCMTSSIWIWSKNAIKFELMSLWTVNPSQGG